MKRKKKVKADTGKLRRSIDLKEVINAAGSVVQEGRHHKLPTAVKEKLGRLEKATTLPSAKPCPIHTPKWCAADCRYRK